ncbi:methyltransferase domain-containing protein [Amorphus sp. 3PC139-8]|uniref:methyltransferase domain-containing protein n=1 Tax=Amorphus sp. 3PC139-8 TaxID=2735676 RepID=UPI00345D6F83
MKAVDNPDPRKAPVLKKIKWFFSAFPKIGVTSKQVKRLALESDLLSAGLRDQANEFTERVVALANADMDSFERRIREDMRDQIDDVSQRLSEIENIANKLEQSQHALTQKLEERLQEASDGFDDRYRSAAEQVDGRLSDLSESLNRQISEISENAKFEQALMARAYTGLDQKLDNIRYGGPKPPPSEEPTSEGLNALLDYFYNRLEARFRGSREEIVRRLTVYLPDARAAVERTGKGVLDLGCGRGEWLELMGSVDIAATGVDSNSLQVAEARAHGLDVLEGDACAFLAEAADASYGMITAHHVVEHLPFRTVAWITQECLRVLAPGGLLLFETPNASSLLVSAKSFYMDPTHIRPLPGPVLTTLLDTVGFHPVETRDLHPHEKLESYFREKKIDPEVAGLLFGPQDLAVLGMKPNPTGTDA